MITSRSITYLSLALFAVLASYSELRGASTLTQGLVTYLNYEQAQASDLSERGTAVTHSNVSSNTLQGHYQPVQSLAGQAGFYNRNQSAYSKIPLSFGSPTSALGYQFSVSAWYYLQPSNLNPSGDKRMFVYESDENYELSFYIKGLVDDVTGPFKKEGVLSTHGGNNNIGVATSFDEVTKLGAWNHLVDTFSLSGNTVTKKSYLNGTLVNTINRSIDSSAASPFLAASGINLGTYRDNNGRFWDGFLDEVGVWNRALTAQEISELYTLNLSGFSVVPEPSRALVALIGLAACCLSRRRL